MVHNVELAKDTLSESTSDIDTYFNGIDDLYPHYEYEKLRSEALANWRKWEFSGSFNLLQEEEVYNEARSSLIRFTVEASSCIERMSKWLVSENIKQNSDKLQSTESIGSLPQGRRIEVLSEIGIIPTDQSKDVNKQLINSVNKVRSEVVHETPTALDLSGFSTVAKYLLATSKVMNFFAESVYDYTHDEIAVYLEKCMRNPYREVPIDGWTLAQLVSRYQQYCNYLINPEVSFIPDGQIDEYHEKVRKNGDAVQKIESEIEDREYNLDIAIKYNQLERLGRNHASILIKNIDNISGCVDVPDDIVCGKDYKFSITADFSEIDEVLDGNVDGVHWRGLLGVSDPSLHSTPQDYRVYDVFPQNGDGTIGRNYTKVEGDSTAEFSHFFKQPSNYLIQLMIRIEAADHTVFIVGKRFRTVSPQSS